MSEGRGLNQHTQQSHVSMVPFPVGTNEISEAELTAVAGVAVGRVGAYGYCSTRGVFDLRTMTLDVRETKKSATESALSSLAGALT
ncbi:MAG: hypothetical protein ABI155_02205 [Paralcaligenes sp.]